MILLWGFIFLLALAVIFLIWLQFNNQEDNAEISANLHLEEKIVHLEENLKKDLGNYARSRQKNACTARSDGSYLA